MKIFSCNSNPKLASEICSYLNTSLASISVKRFADQEVFTEIGENVRGQDIFIIQSTNNPANDHLMELLVTIDAARRGSARRITAVIPYFGYARQDRKTGPRTPISAKLVANLITTAGADRVLTMDLHAGQVQGFFDIPVDNMYVAPVVVPDIRERFGNDDSLMIVSPDIGGVVRARAMASKLGCDLAIIDKRRPKAGVSEVMNVIGDVKDRHCILMDDMVDSAGTLCNAAQALIDKGAREVRAYCTHGVFSGKALERIENSVLKEIVVTDSILSRDEIRNCTKIRYLPIAPIMGEAIKRIHEECSVSSLFEIAYDDMKQKKPA